MVHQCFSRDTKVKTAYDHMQPLHLNNFVKMQPGLYLPVLSCHTGLLVACLALGSTTWLRPPCYCDVACSQAEQISPYVLFDQVPLMYLTTARLCYVSRVGVRLAFSQRVHCETCTLFVVSSETRGSSNYKARIARGNQDGIELF